MGGPYRYDVAELEGVAGGLRQIAEDFDSSRQDYVDVSGALGSSHVREALDDFTDDWRKKRDKQSSMLTSASDALDTIVAGYREGDRGAAAGLRGEQ